MGKKLNLSRLTDEEAKHVWEVVQRDFDLRKTEEERLEIAKTGSLEWYYEHVRTRFKHFGSAKVVRSLYRRMSHGQKTKSTSLDDYHLYRNNESEEGETSDDVDGAESESYARMRKKKRLLSVHSFDFETDSEYSSQSRRQSVQLSPCPGKEGLQSTEDFPNGEEASMQKDSMVAEADLAAVFHHILQEQRKHTAIPEQEFSTEVQFIDNSHTKNLETIPKAGSPWKVQPQRSAKVDTSDEDEKGAQETFIYQPPYPKHRSQESSQENVNHSGNQILELNKRISVIESMLSRLEEKILVHSEKVNLEQKVKELKRKLEELTNSITKKAASIDEENAGKKTEESKPEMDSSNEDLPPDAKKVLSSVSYGGLYLPFTKALFRQPLCNVTYFPVKSHS
ncbi:hypothetical protein Chor_015691 [Crotalus horridus]